MLSSHVLAELERVADYLIMVSRGRAQVACEVDELLANHRMLTGPASRFWPFQWIESGWLVALSVLLIAITVRMVRRAT